jgi:NADPH2:quinone reductase
MDQAMVIREYGGPEVLKSERVTVGAPGKGQVRLRQTANGVNIHDCYVRSARNDFASEFLRLNQSAAARV